MSKQNTDYKISLVYSIPCENCGKKTYKDMKARIKEEHTQDYVKKKDINLNGPHN